MNRSIKFVLGATALAAFLLSGNAALAQDAQQKPTLQTDKDKKPADQNASQSQGLSLDTPQPAVNAEEDAAFKAFQSAPNSEAAKKTELGEDFLKKYPESRYRSAVLSTLTIDYLSLNQVDKAISAGDKEVELRPDDVQTLAVLSQTISRASRPGSPDAAKNWDKAERYGKKAIEVVPTLPKPEGYTDENFTMAKNQTLAMAHSGVGVVSFWRGKYQDAIPDLEQAVKLDPTPDPVNFYLLGASNQNTSHFEDAVTAYNKCAAIQSTLQSRCKDNAEQAKKQGSTQLSAPK